MSIFSVLKYENTDLGNIDSLNALPKQIFWIYYYKVTNDHLIYVDAFDVQMRCVELSSRYNNDRTQKPYREKLRRLFRETLVEYTE